MSLLEVKKMFSPVIHREDGVYWAEIPAMPGCYTVADTLDEIAPNLLDAIACWALTAAEARKSVFNGESAATVEAMA